MLDFLDGHYEISGLKVDSKTRRGKVDGFGYANSL
jgi:hypothetical protein